jgi:hypothetical protein
VELRLGWIPSNTQIAAVNNRRTLARWVNSDASQFWPAEVVRNVEARSLCLSKNLAAKVDSCVFSVRLATELYGLCTFLDVCPERCHAAQQKLQVIPLVSNPVRIVTPEHILPLWNNCKIGELTIRDNGEQGCEYRAHAICELINVADPQVGAKFLFKFWVDAGRQVLGPQHWSHHVAPVVLTPQTAWVFDPALLGQPCTIDDWLGRLLPAGSQIPCSMQAWERLGKPIANDPLSQLDDWLIEPAARIEIDRDKRPKG